MGLLDRLGRLADAAGITVPAAAPPASPWTSGQLHTIAWGELGGQVDAMPISRAVAMRSPAIVKARSLISVIARQPLRRYTTGRDSRELETLPWLEASRYASPLTRMLWTIDDQIFTGASLWALDREPGGEIVDALRLPPAWWQINPDSGQIKIVRPGCREITPSAEEVCLLEGPQEGLLDIAQGTIRASLAMEEAWADRVTSPVPNVELHATDQTMNLTDDEIQSLVDKWEEARKRGGTAYTPPGIDVKVHGNIIHELFIGGRNAARIDIANFLSMPTTLLDGSVSQSSLSYVTAEGKAREFVDYTLRYWAAPIEDRLSQDDIAGYGVRFKFDFTNIDVALLTKDSDGTTHAKQKDTTNEAD